MFQVFSIEEPYVHSHVWFQMWVHLSLAHILLLVLQGNRVYILQWLSIQDLWAIVVYPIVEQHRQYLHYRTEFYTCLSKLDKSILMQWDHFDKVHLKNTSPRLTLPMECGVIF